MDNCPCGCHSSNQTPEGYHWTTGQTCYHGPESWYYLDKQKVRA